MKKLALLVVLACAAQSCSAEPEVKRTVITLPEQQPAPPPPPMPPATDSPVRLKPNSWYVVRSTVKCIVMTSPGSTVKVTAEAGPLRLRGLFSDGTGVVETRNYAEPFLYIIEAAAPGRCELFIVPTGVMTESEIVRRTLEVGDPAPPAKPTVSLTASATNVKPDTEVTLTWVSTGAIELLLDARTPLALQGSLKIQPRVTTDYTITATGPGGVTTASVTVMVKDTVPVPVPVTGLRVLLVCETSANLTRQQLLVWNSTKLSAFLNSKVAKDGTLPAWRRWDKDQNVDNENETMKNLWAATKPKLGALPCIVIVSDQSGEVLTFPATEDEAIALVQRKMEGK